MNYEEQTRDTLNKIVEMLNLIRSELQEMKESQKLRTPRWSWEDQLPQHPVSTSNAASLLHVPTKWLQKEIEEGRIPALLTDRSALVHVPTALKLLKDRCMGEYNNEPSS